MIDNDKVKQTQKVIHRYSYVCNSHSQTHNQMVIKANTYTKKKVITTLYL